MERTTLPSPSRRESRLSGPGTTPAVFRMAAVSVEKTCEEYFCTPSTVTVAVLTAAMPVRMEPTVTAAIAASAAALRTSRPRRSAVRNLCRHSSAAARTPRPFALRAPKRSAAAANRPPQNVPIFWNICGGPLRPKCLKNCNIFTLFQMLKAFLWALSAT